MSFEITALLPMKGSSERVKDKNTKDFGGKPLFFHILESLLQSKYIVEVLVNTDSDYIEELINDNFEKTRILKRPEFLLGAKVPMTPIIEYDLTYSKTEHFLQTHATNPMLKTGTIDKAIEIYFDGLKNGYDSAFGVNAYKTRFYDSEFVPINHDPDIMVPSQDMPKIYEDNSNFYINSKETFFKYNNRIGKKPVLVEVPKIEALDIDEPEDWIIALAVYNKLKS